MSSAASPSRAAPSEASRTQAGFANDGQGRSVVGGSAVGGLIGIGTTHLRTRGNLVKDELIRAAQAHGARPPIAELEAAWNDLIEPGAKGRLRSEVVDQLKAHLVGTSGEEIVDQQFLPTLARASTLDAHGRPLPFARRVRNRQIMCVVGPLLRK